MRRLIAAALLFLVAMHGGAAGAADRAEVERQFRAWLEDTLWPAASARGVARTTFDTAFTGVGLEWSLPDLAPPGAPEVEQDFRQAEFRAPARYFDRGNIDTLAGIGRGHLSRWKDTLDAIEASTGVPRAIIVAIWGRESEFGAADIPHDAVAILATQAFMGRRRDMFAGELIAALDMLEQRHVARAAMKSSWAGALGQPQFLPSKYLAHAADGDGDGFADIWESVPDTLASIASYLKANGWQTGRDWGFEATIPDGVSCALDGPDQGKPITEWEMLGVTRVSGRPFPDHERAMLGYLVMPAGRQGPAFIATENFYVLKTYNESDLYALFIGHLADRMNGGRAFAAPWRRLDSFSRGDVQAMQKSLEASGYDVGGADGLVGFKTRRSLGDWQARNDLAPTCFPDAALIARFN